MSHAVLPSLAKVGIHEVEQLAEHRIGELLRPKRHRLCALARVLIMRHYCTSPTIEAIAKSRASYLRQPRRHASRSGTPGVIAA